ncbi:major capsid protein [Enterobacter hormaechei]|uniref:major capsid protein n=1 Tax=Enterobacter hormaechei TaxID=158836 RepID=UPI002A75A24F|nr:major capsid protein [Enterobacter hormaechei]MDY3572318.1 major capsid protein [Enterobacter hormaechei]
MSENTAVTSYYTMRELLGAVTQKFKFRQLFLELFFPETFTFESEEVYLDKIPGEVPMAVYCAPMVTGKVDHSRGSKTSSFKPGYVKSKHAVNPNQSIKRRPGEDPSQPMSMTDRRAAIIAQNLKDEELSILQLEEYQGVQAVLYGKYTLTSDRFPTQEIDMQRSPENNIVQSAGTAWSAQDPETFDPTDDIDRYADNASGAIDIMVLDGLAWKTLNSFKRFREKLDTRRGSRSRLETALKDLGDVVSYKGFYGDVMIVVYKGQYIDPDTGEKTRFMPENTMVLGNTMVRGLRTYGAVVDEDAIREGLTEGTRFPKTWTVIGDPGVTMTMTQSAPAMFLPDPDAFVVVQLA